MGLLNIVGSVAKFALKATVTVAGAAINQGMKNMETMNNARYNSGNKSDAELRSIARDQSRNRFERMGAAAAVVDRKNNK